MKILFLHFFDFSPFSGISKKIYYQISAFRNLGHNADICYIKIDNEGQQYRVCGDNTIDVFGKGPLAKILKWFRFKNLTSFIKDNGYDLLYVRSFYNTTPTLLKMYRILHKAGIKIIVEFPTYPYEREFNKIPLKNKFTFYIDKVFRCKLKKHVDFIVTFSDYDEIFGVKSIQISNGIDFDQVKIKKESNGIKKNIRLLGVAEIHYWHGFDRVIKGLADYYSGPDNNRADVFFDIVGEGVKEDLEYLKQLVRDNNLGDYVVFHGNCHGEQLDNLFDKADFGVASLARHRSGITKIKT
ncbi:MAG: glycosyltransferase family 1 protein, partial [Bacteroidales bacterium]|nr:glycosyltransferase family 1 protein [Bacteroidales bacterium]